MSAVAAPARVTLPAWQGWLRSGSGFPAGEADRDGRRLELGAAVFSLPDPREARTTSWACAGGVFGVFSGYLYNRRELAAELDLEEAPSPADVALAAYRRWGCDAFSRLEGAFALALWDQPEETLLCARDTPGLHPFYYADVSGDLVFSWDLEAVLRHPSVSRELNRVALAEHLIHHWWNVHETYFRAVRRLPGGYALKAARGRQELFRHWSPKSADGRVNWITQEEVGDFPALFRNAVQSVMECGHGRVGIFLSGGLDSVSVASWAADIASERGWPRPRALSVIFPEAACEEPVQRGVAHALGLPQTFVDLRDLLEGPGLLRRGLDLASWLPAPPTLIYAPAFLKLLGSAMSQDCELVLTGDGGDELLTVTPGYSADLIRSGDLIGLARLIGIIMRYWKGSPVAAVRSTAWTWGLRAILRNWIWLHAPHLAMRRRRQLQSKALPAWLAPDPALRRELIYRYEEKWNRETTRGSFYEAQIGSSIWHPLPHINFEEQFYRNATVGAPSLHPYWHRKMVDFLLRAHPEVLNGRGRWKGLVRSAMVERFPDLGFEKQKKVVVTDLPKKLLRLEGPGLWRYLNQARWMERLGMVDLEPYHAALNRGLATDDIFEMYRTWHGASVEAWIRAHS